MGHRNQLPRKETLLPPKNNFQELSHSTLLLHVLRPYSTTSGFWQTSSSGLLLFGIHKRRSPCDIQILWHCALYGRPGRMIPSRPDSFLYKGLVLNSVPHHIFPYRTTLSSQYQHLLVHHANLGKSFIVYFCLNFHTSLLTFGTTEEGVRFKNEEDIRFSL